MAKIEKLVFVCRKCKIAFLEKPTHTTTCPSCKERLSLYVPGEAVDDFFIYGSEKLKVNRELCWSCGRKVKLSTKTYYLLREPQQVTDYEETDTVHKKCWKNMPVEEKEGYKVAIK